MTRLGIRSALIALALTALVAAAGCGGDDDSSDEAKPAKTATGPDAEALARAERERRIAAAKEKRAGKKGRPKKSRREIREQRAREAAQLRKEREQERREDREFDKGFEETPFDKLVDKLPIRKPPLYVEQYITDAKSHKLHTAVDRKRFFCKMTPRQRKKAVEGSYRAADKVMRSGGVTDFVQVVTLTAETLEDLPTLATARKGSVSLTKLGRGKGPC